MGDPFMVHCFPRAFTHVIEPWTSQWRKMNNADHKLVVKCPVTMHEVDLSIHLYADDINKKVLQHPPAQKEDVNLDKLRGKLQQCDRIMDERLFKYAQYRIQQNFGETWYNVFS